MQSPDAWPESLHAAIRTCGVNRVWNVGLAMLGYPPTWIDSGRGAAAVLQALRDAVTAVPKKVC